MGWVGYGRLLTSGSRSTCMKPDKLLAGVSIWKKKKTVLVRRRREGGGIYHTFRPHRASCKRASRVIQAPHGSPWLPMAPHGFPWLLMAPHDMPKGPVGLDAPSSPHDLQLESFQPPVAGQSPRSLPWRFNRHCG